MKSPQAWIVPLLICAFLLLMIYPALAQGNSSNENSTLTGSGNTSGEDDVLASGSTTDGNGTQVIPFLDEALESGNVTGLQVNNTTGQDLSTSSDGGGGAIPMYSSDPSDPPELNETSDELPGEEIEPEPNELSEEVTEEITPTTVPTTAAPPAGFKLPVLKMPATNRGKIAAGGVILIISMIAITAYLVWLDRKGRLS
jgi:hypothetical protein